MKKLLKFLLSRVVIVGLLILLQAVFFVVALWMLNEKFAYLYPFMLALSIICVIWIVGKQSNPAYKIPWIIIILALPIFGGLFYVFFGNNKVPKALRGQVEVIYEKTGDFLVSNQAVTREIQAQSKHTAKQSRYISTHSYYPVYKNTQTTYLSPGEELFAALVEELKKAEHFIFMEYFIIEEGVMFDTVMDILEEKARAGVDVRMIYDDVGSLMTVPSGYYKKIRSRGIKCYVFNEFRPRLQMQLNNRDHRKITVIDGHVGFTGGINLADEYINEKERFGHWKDASIMLKGDAVWNLSVMFLQFWQYCSKQTEDFEKFRPDYYQHRDYGFDGYVQPYADSPLDAEIVGENVYLNIISNATEYVYINTPYLIVDNETLQALSLAAKSGIDVRIVTPHIPDKWYVHMVTRSYYRTLIEAGVKIYEYTPGFIHSKTFVADDAVAVVGTTNLDFRSLYLHFECGVWMYKSRAVSQLKADYLATLKKCEQMTLQKCDSEPLPKRMLTSVLKVFSPLM
ncbi:cardiolipin synthase [Neobittarella massiliensis]|uniref:Cardiolipin synthase n=2 Tax=Oscillospiraceae TaxID=216572 RepID=A0A8J6IJT2_9FIRM|nr:cardiolipin synthase [Neobittarella massiliensis]MBC3515861.1 cardiolipin synthase [Neobittarella massiliensis]SCJ43943.1 Cardiolipin synthase [uncultured Anaerotruncus sp.]